jgi:hypothetical protein
LAQRASCPPRAGQRKGRFVPKGWPQCGLANLSRNFS